MKFKNKKELVNFVKEQLNVELENKKDNILNNKRNLLYTEIKQGDRLAVLGLLKKYNIYYEQHVKDSYFIMIK